MLVWQLVTVRLHIVISIQNVTAKDALEILSSAVIDVVAIVPQLKNS